MKAKVCIVGEFSVGKTSVSRRLVKNSFDAEYRATLGVSILQKSLEVQGETCDLVLWDLEGGEDRLPTLKSYFVGASGAVLVADLSRPATIDKLSVYIRFLRDTVPDIALVVALNKLDLVRAEDFDLAEIANKLALQEWKHVGKKDSGSLIAMTSAADGTAVEPLFISLCSQMLESARAS